MQLSDLKEVGLTTGEIKIYGALLELGETTRTQLAKHSGVSPSKIYDVANRLLEKGIISAVKKNNVLHFSAADPERLKDFIRTKEESLRKERYLVDSLMPQLLAKYGDHRDRTDVEVFYGWEGMKTVFYDLANTLEEDDTNYIFGAGQGYDSKQADRFFNQYYWKKKRKGFATKIIFNEAVRGNKDRTKPFNEKPNQMRFMDQQTFAEFNMYRDTVLFILLLKEPMVIRIRSQEAADTCRTFFDTMWKLAKK